ncbi:28_t:CDS:2 [Cetraspora pellucida]|uniref:28_t:CDS:1 n=1 Tax=Cetraspora pellucida TaxID=1433469 RepID=A0ACA9KMP6_9GLOM|nr:28_t:CDS:2 [Cetraspora pellucida]
MLQPRMFYDWDGQDLKPDSNQHSQCSPIMSRLSRRFWCSHSWPRYICVLLLEYGVVVLGVLLLEYVVVVLGSLVVTGVVIRVLRSCCRCCYCDFACFYRIVLLGLVFYLRGTAFFFCRRSWCHCIYVLLKCVADFGVIVFIDVVTGVVIKRYVIIVGAVIAISTLEESNGVALVVV